MRLPSASRWAAWPVQLRTAALQEAADGGIGYQADRPLGGGGSLLLESPHHPLRSADEVVGEAGRFREAIPNGAGKGDPLRGAQVDQVTDADEDWIDAVV